MYNFYQWYVRFKQYSGFSKSEKQWLAISVIVLAFIAGFNDGSKEFMLNSWLRNFVIILISVAIAIYVREVMHRLWGIEQGYKVEFKPQLYGLIAGLIVAFMSYGLVPLMIYGGVTLDIMEKHRLGYFRYRLGYQHLASTSVMASVSTIILAMIVKLLPFIPQEFATKFIWVNVLIAVTNMLPIPGLDGANVLYASRKLWFFSFGGILGAGALLIIPGLSPIFAVIGGIFAGILFFIVLLFVIKSS